MKKILSLVLTLCLLCGVVALADSTVDLSLTILEDPYIVNIPSETVGFTSAGENSYVTNFDVTVSGVLPADVTSLVFSVSSAQATSDSWNLHNAEAEEEWQYLPYEINFQDAEGNDVFIYTGDEFLTVVEGDYTENNRLEDYGTKLFFNVRDTSEFPAGTYTDTLTFTIVEVKATAAE